MATTTTPTPDPTIEAGLGGHAGPDRTAPKGHVGRIVAGALIGGFAVAVFVVAVPLAGATESVITGSVLLTFAAAWCALAVLSSRRTDQPQRWAFVPAAFMAVAGVKIG